MRLVAGPSLSLASALGIACMVALAPADASAQRRVTAAPRLEARVGALLSPRAAPTLGAGLSVRAGWYARLSLAAETGAVPVGDAWRTFERVSASARFLLDPFGERRLGLYGGAGLAWRVGDQSPPQGALFLVLGAEGPAHTRRLVPAFELAVGGGLQATIILRARRPDSR